MSNRKTCNDLSGKEWLQFSFSIWRDLKKSKEEKDLGHPASYPVALCERLIRTFSKKGSRVLDPFNGIGSTMVACQNLGSEGYGIDLNNDYCEAAKKRLADNALSITIANGNSIDVLKLHSENYFDICVTSPPYWNVLNMKRSADYKESVNYSDSKVDLGNIDEYENFINELGLVFKEVHRVLIPGGYCIVNVMDIRKKSSFYPLHIDLALELQKYGYELDDIIIWDRQSEYNNMRPLGYPFKFRINKVHEYLMIFIKK